MKAGLSTLHTDFPISEWDRLLPHAFLILNLLHPSNVNPCLSAYSYLFDSFDFNKTPIPFPGSKIVTHNKPAQRASWDLTGKLGFYISPALKHNRCISCFNPTTKSETISDTVMLIQYTIIISVVTIDNFFHEAASDIINILTQPSSLLPNTCQIGNKIPNSLLQLATLLKTRQITNDTLQHLQIFNIITNHYPL